MLLRDLVSSWCYFFRTLNMIPKEHGAWGMLITTFIIGTLCAPTFSPAVLFFAGASLSYFMLRAPLLALKDARWQKSYKADTRKAFLWLAIYTAAMTVFAAPLFLMYKKWLLLIFFALSLPMLVVHIFYSSENFRSMKNELISFAALCMTAPLAYYAASDGPNARALSLYLLCVLYYTGPVFYVKMNVTARMKKNEVTTLGGKFVVSRYALMYHVCALAASYLLSLSIAPRLSYLAFIQPFGKVLARALKLDKPIPIKNLGWLEVVYALLFAALIITAYRIQ